MWLHLLAVSLLADVAPRPLPSPPPAQCRGNTDCVLSTFEGCCGSCCPRAPHAIPKGSNETSRCAVIDCAMIRCEEKRCAAAPQVSDFEAVCQSGQCIAMPRTAVECRVDAECQVATVSPPAGAACHQSPCGCCPVNVAVSVERPQPAPWTPRRPAPPQTSPAQPAPESKPTFGLSTGGGASPAPDRPQCSPCPAPAPMRAVCRENRCVSAPLIRPPHPG